MKSIDKYFHKTLLLCFVILTLINIINCWLLKIEYVLLSENQILYIYSSLAQVIGALLGLTISGYSVMDSKMKTLSDSDDTLTDYVADIRPHYFKSFIYIIIFSIVNIILCLLVIATYDNTYNKFTPFFMTESIIVFIFIMTELLRFVHYLNPSTIRKMGSHDKDSIDTEYQNTTPQNEASENFSSFITNYNVLEKLVKDFACNLIDSPDSAYKIQFFDSLNILLHNEIINRETYSIIDEFRRYRNALVHSLDTDKSVNPSIYQKLDVIYKLLKAVYDARISKSDQEFETNKIELMHYSETHGYNEIDRKILNYLKTRPNASLRELAEHTNHTVASMHHRIVNLQKIGVVTKTGQGKHMKWQVNSNIF